MKRFLTSDEIEYILDFFTPQKGIPYVSAVSIMESNKNRFRSQLVDQEIHPELIDDLKNSIEKNWFSSLIQPGESVGVICAQSIGEKNTQTALNTFHKAGQSEKTMTEGVPRFQELLNATKNPRMVNHRIFFKKGNGSIQETRKTVNNKLCNIFLKDLIKDNGTYILTDVKPEKWYDAYKILYGDTISEYSNCIKIEMKRKKMYEFMITEKLVADVISNEYSDIECIFSPYEDGVIYVFVDTTEVINKLEGQNIAFINEQNAVEIYMEDIVLADIENLDICGVPGINEIFYTVESGEWMVETNSENTKENNYIDILSIDFVDELRTTSNNIWDIYETLGVEATKEFLIDEFMSIMEGINMCHAVLLVDRMTFNGSVSSISRYTLKNDECGPMGKASFEESLDNFLIAGSNGEIESTSGVSASIICGKRSNIGTGMMSLRIDTSKFK